MNIILRNFCIAMLLLGVIMQAQSLPRVLVINQKNIPLIFEHSSLIPTAFIRLSFLGAGSIRDSKPSLALIASSMLSRGTKTLGFSKFSEELESRAIDLDIYAGNDTLNIQINFLKEKQEDALRLLAQLFQDPNLTQEELKKVQEESINKLVAKQNDFDYLANNQLYEILFKNTPLASFPTKEDIQNIQLEDIKKYIQNLNLSQLVLVIGGDIQIQDLVAQNQDDTRPSLQKVLSNLQNGSPPKDVHYEANPHTKTQYLYKDTQQAYIYFGSPFKVENLQADSYKAKVMGFILGSSGFGSRLMDEIRVKRGMAYSAYMRISTGKIANYSIGYVQTKLQNQDAVIKLIQEVVGNFVQNGATQEELDSAKQFLLGSQPLRRETLSQRLDREFINYYLGLPLDFDSKELEQIAHLTLEELNNYIKSHTEIKQLSFSVLTNKENKEKVNQSNNLDSIKLLRE